MGEKRQPEMCLCSLATVTQSQVLFLDISYFCVQGFYEIHIKTNSNTKQNTSFTIVSY